MTLLYSNQLPSLHRAKSTRIESNMTALRYFVWISKMANHTLITSAPEMRVPHPTPTHTSDAFKQYVFRPHFEAAICAIWRSALQPDRPAISPLQYGWMERSTASMLQPISLPSSVVGGSVNQAYSRFSTTHGHIANCKLGSVAYAGLCVVSYCGPVLFRPNDLRPTIFECQTTDSIPPQVSRKESFRPFILTRSRPVGCLTH